MSTKIKMESGEHKGPSWWWVVMNDWLTEEECLFAVFSKKTLCLSKTWGIEVLWLFLLLCLSLLCPQSLFSFLLTVGLHSCIYQRMISRWSTNLIVSMSYISWRAPLNRWFFCFFVLNLLYLLWLVKSEHYVNYN